MRDLRSRLSEPNRRRMMSDWRLSTTSRRFTSSGSRSKQRREEAVDVAEADAVLVDAALLERLGDDDLREHAHAIGELARDERAPAPDADVLPGRAGLQGMNFGHVLPFLWWSAKRPSVRGSVARYVRDATRNASCICAYSPRDAQRRRGWPRWSDSRSTGASSAARAPRRTTTPARD